MGNISIGPRIFPTSKKKDLSQLLCLGEMYLTSPAFAVAMKACGQILERLHFASPVYSPLPLPWVALLRHCTNDIPGASIPHRRRGLGHHRRMNAKLHLQHRLQRGTRRIRYYKVLSDLVSYALRRRGGEPSLADVEEDSGFVPGAYGDP